MGSPPLDSLWTVSVCEGGCLLKTCFPCAQMLQLVTKANVEVNSKTEVKFRPAGLLYDSRHIHFLSSLTL